MSPDETVFAYSMIDNRDEPAGTYEFTIFTPTYDRVGTLERLFKSIDRQTRRNFEWLIVDDGSSDGTGLFLESLASQADFPIRYIWQPNAGKHMAFNRGVREARGTLFLTIDSDDELTPDAVEVLHDAWEAIPVHDRDGFTGVTARCIDQHGHLVGESARHSPLDSDSAETTFVLKLHGERIGFHRRDILLEHLFPEDVPTRFIPEGRIWLDIARRYKTRFIEAPARLFHDHDEARLSGLDRAQRALGDREYYCFALLHYGSWWCRAPGPIAKLAIGLRRAELHLEQPCRRTGFSIPARILIAMASIVAIPLYYRDLRTRHGTLGRRLFAARLLLRGRGGPAIAARLGERTRRHGSDVTIGTADVISVLDPGDPRDDEPLFSPKTYKAGVVRALSGTTADTGSIAVLGDKAMFVALHLARLAPNATVFAIEPDARQSSRTRAAARASYAANVSAVTASDIAAALPVDCDLVHLCAAEAAADRIHALAEKRPRHLAIEVGTARPPDIAALTADLQRAGYRVGEHRSGPVMMATRAPEDPMPPDTA